MITIQGHVQMFDYFNLSYPVLFGPWNETPWPSSKISINHCYIFMLLRYKVLETKIHIDRLQTEEDSIKLIWGLQ